MSLLNDLQAWAKKLTPEEVTTIKAEIGTALTNAKTVIEDVGKVDSIVPSSLVSLVQINDALADLVNVLGTIQEVVNVL